MYEAAALIRRVEMRCQRVTRIETKMDPPGCVLWDYQERLRVDGASAGTILPRETSK